ncbi:Histone-lysine N-methyltransferase setd2, partial [Mortierella sp. AD032]
DIWSKEKSRPASPAKEGAAQQPDSGIPTLDDASKALPVGPRVPETFPEQVVISGQVPAPVPAPATTPASTPPVTTTITTVQTAVLGEDAISRPQSAVVSRNNSPPAQMAPTPLRNLTRPTELQSAISVAASTEQSTPITLGPSTSQHSNSYHYRSNSGHGEYPPTRYAGSYSHSQYHRPSSNHPSYSKSHHYRGSSSRAYSSSASYPPSIELPPNWSKASDPEGRIYYYNEITRATQWDPPRIESPAEVLPEPAPHVPISRYGPNTSSHSYHRTPQSLQQQQSIPVARMPSPEPPKPVNIDGFTQEQLQEVIGRAYDKQKQKNLANGSGSAGASVHDVDSPSTRATHPLSPSVRLSSSGKPLKPMSEKDLKAALSASVVKTMAKYKTKLGSSEAFKKHARRITHLIADKEMRSKTFKAGEVTEVTQGMKNKMRRFIKEYMTKLFKKLPKEERSSSNSAPASLSNGSKLTQSHIPEQEFDGLPAVYHGSVVPSKGQESTAGKKHIKAGGDKKSMGYGDVEVDDDDDVKYGEGDDGDEDEGDLEGEEDDDGGVAAVPSASVELPL